VPLCSQSRHISDSSLRTKSSAVPIECTPVTRAAQLSGTAQYAGTVCGAVLQYWTHGFCVAPPRTRGVYRLIMVVAHSVGPATSRATYRPATYRVVMPHRLSARGRLAASPTAALHPATSATGGALRSGLAGQRRYTFRRSGHHPMLEISSAKRARSNPSLQPTCYGWLRQPPQAAELKR
jgi:hypothetical protein